MENKILLDIATLYRYLEEENRKTNGLYESIKSDIPIFLKPIFKKMPVNQETLLALIDRVVALKEGALLNVLNKLQFKEEEILEIRTLMLRITEDFYVKRHQKLLEFVKDRNLLTPFLRELLVSVHQVGLVFNSFFINWQEKLILGINKDLSQKFNNDLPSILEALKSAQEISQNGEVSDRSYSVPVLKEGKYEAMAYADFFKGEFETFQATFEKMLLNLESIPEVCPKFEQKDSYLAYFKALQKALMQKDTTKLLESWRDVDKAWMKITTPLQVGHPLEYYEDHYRKAVAPEWDLRIARIYEGKDLLDLDSTNEVSKEAFMEFYSQYTAKMPQTSYKKEIDFCVQESLAKTQSYGGQPLLFYGAELNGLFSAQVVPNDESVSSQYGKKIFYFPDRVWEISCAKPFMLLSRKTFPEKFLDFNREMLYFRKKDWYKVYEISTIGHEFGHILWVSLDSELQINKSGQFKNIEEFKATMGGLAYYFVAKNQPLLKELVFNMISRAVGLMAWKKEDEVLPYYCEGLIHLDILFSSEILEYVGNFESVALKIYEERIPQLVERYLQVYDELIKIYLNKADALEFLSKYTLKDAEGYFMPLREEVYTFVRDYYEQYNAIGQVVDHLSIAEWKENYLKGKKIATY
ncbi:invasion protein CiaB [Helicobacter canadensis]|uniref:DUF7897 domain-containing protein n=2 Tax=Helicobacter canadensis TaxID=123841 RepID=C5ZWU5_9HELI|nr:invasion protein CiaB [Helicobacter canadensis]EES89613.1 conserved hypothetical protein [Helicobacter canadensis MIT 98-5491]STO99649.1 CiaB protein [Helicobacter canadensis]